MAMIDVALLALLAATVPWAATAPPPPVATLTVRLADDRSTHAIGELVPLELEFRGRAGPDYFFSTASGDRLRGSRERYGVSPAGGSHDPMAEFLASAGIVGSVSSTWHPLDGTPLVLRVHLNEWVRFERPGEYQLVVESSRLERYSRQPAPTVVSAPLTIRIVEASPGWAAAELARATEALAGRGPSSVEEGARILRHLGTREAALALVRFYGAGSPRLQLEWSAGLVASPFRAAAVEAMEGRIDSGGALPAGFVRDLGLLRSLLDRPSGPPAARFERQATAACEYARRWVGALSLRERSAGELVPVLQSLEDPVDPACDVTLAPLLQVDPAASAEAFRALPTRTQALLLEHQWSALSGPWVRPVLESVFDGWRGDSRVPGAGDAALRRLAEMDPSRGRALALEEIRTGLRGLAFETLASLVEGPLPGFDGALRERYGAARSDDDRVAAMWAIARYGSKRLLPLVLAEVEDGATCDLEAAAIAYLLDHDPPPALRRLQPGFDRGRRPTCVTPPWWPLAARHWSEAVEDAAIANLGSRDVRLACEAAHVLGAHGSPRVKNPLFDRFARWNEDWRGRRSEIQALAEGSPALDSPVLLEGTLAGALLDGRSFTLTPEEMERVEGLCLTTACRENVAARLRARRGRIPRAPAGNGPRDDRGAGWEPPSG